MSNRTALSIVVSWRDRHELRFIVPSLVDLARRLRGEVIIVNFGGSAQLLQAELQEFAGEVRVDTVSGAEHFNKAAAQNVGASYSRFPNLFFCDCDCIVDPASVVRTVKKSAARPAPVRRSPACVKAFATRGGRGTS